jgi:hypothetical protein
MLAKGSNVTALTTDINISACFLSYKINKQHELACGAGPAFSVLHMIWGLGQAVSCIYGSKRLSQSLGEDVLMESSEQGWPCAEAQFTAANSMQSEKYPKAPPLPKISLPPACESEGESEGEGKVLPPSACRDIPPIRFTAFAVRLGSHFDGHGRGRFLRTVKRV